MNAEFDHYIKDYRKNLDNSLSLSGESSTFFAEYKALKLKEWLPGKDLMQQNILDFGCGDGLMTSFVSKHFPLASVYGVDPSPGSIEVAQQNFPTLKFSINYDQKPDLDFEDNTFDIVFAAGAFHHIPFERHLGYMQEINRVLKKDGAFVMFELNPLNPVTSHIFKNNPIDQNAFMLKSSYAKSLCKNVFNNKKVTIKFYGFFPGFLGFLRPSEKFLTKIPLGGLFGTIVK